MGLISNSLLVRTRNLFALVFFASFTLGIIVQKVLPFFFPKAHLGYGLFIGDALSVHEGGVAWASSLAKGVPFSDLAWQYPHVLNWMVGLPYFCFGPHPWLLLFWQAGLHALAAVSFYRTLMLAGFSRASALAGMGWLVGNPQVLEWVTQLQKDGMFLAGQLLLLQSFLENKKKSLPCMIFGALLVLLSRPYWVKVLGILFGILILVEIGRFLWAVKGRTFNLSPLLHRVAGACLFFFLQWCCQELTGPFRPMFLSLQNTHEGNWLMKDVILSKSSPKQRANVLTEEDALSLAKWKGSGNDMLDRFSFQIFSLRKTGILVGGRSLIDESCLLASPAEQIVYLPRALQISLFAPFPNEIWQGSPDGRQDPKLRQARRWHQDSLSQKVNDLGKVMMPFLTLTGALFLLGHLFFLCPEFRKPITIILILFFIPQLALLSEVCPNVGTLTRLRYPFWSALTGSGLALWVSYLFPVARYGTSRTVRKCR